MPNDDVQPNELAMLKERADLMRIQYHPNIGVDKLKEKINAAMGLTPDTDDGEGDEEQPVDTGRVRIKASVETARAKQQRLIQEATRLVRVRVTNMDPAKREYEGAIYSVSNSVVGTVKKYVPFNSDEGYHVPYILYKHMLERQCQIFVNAKGPRGNKIRKGKLIKELAVELLPDLTGTELRELGQRQAMANGSSDY